MMRRAFGVKLDEKFRPVDDSRVRPNPKQWAEIQREGKRANAPWLKTAKPTDELGEPLLARGADPLAETLLSSFIQQPLNRQSVATRRMNALNAAAGAVLMQTATGLRDTAFGLSELQAYVPDKSVIGAVIDSLTQYRAMADSARASGSVPNDVYRNQVAGTIGQALYTATRLARDITGRQFLDTYPRIVAHSVVKQAVLDDIKLTGKSKLFEEFGDLTKTTPNEMAESTAAAVVNRIAPQYDARALPRQWIPQTAGLIGQLTRLSTWGVARFNTWYEDSYRPALKEKSPGRLMRSLLLGLIGAAAVNALTDELMKKKPARLTWQEWLGLSGERQQQEFAPLVFSLLQGQGTLGVLGDLMQWPVTLGNRLVTGGGPAARLPDIGQASVPLLITGQDVYRTIADFGQYMVSKGWHVDARDLTDLAWELGKSAQNVRALEGWLDRGDVADVRREVQLYQQLEDRSATTGRRLVQPLFATSGYRPGSKFSLNKAFNTRTGEDLKSLVPGLVEAAKRGNVPKVINRDLTPAFWKELAQRRGQDVAQDIRNKVRVQQKEEGYRERLRQKLSSLAE